MSERVSVCASCSAEIAIQDLKDFMRSAGEITYADAHKQRQGEGLVT